MATWKSSHSIKFVEDDGYEYKNVELRWEYQTTSDMLTIFDNNGHTSCFSKEQAIATYQLLKDWVKTYEGEEKL